MWADTIATLCLPSAMFYELDAGIDGKLLWLMVEDFNEFSAIVTNPVERLYLKQFVMTHNNWSKQATSVSCGDAIEVVTTKQHIVCE